MEKETEILTILFERKVLTKKDGGIIYSYLPLEVLRGKEHNFDGTKIFSAPSKSVRSLRHVENENKNEDEHTFEFNYMDDICNMDEKYVYGFSVIIDNQKPSEIKKLYDWMTDDIEEIKEHAIFHTYKTLDGWCKLFVTVNDLNVNIDPNNYYELQDLMYGQLDDFSDNIRDLIESNKERITIPSFVVTYNPEVKPLYSNEIYDAVSKTVICQDDQIKTIASAISKNSCLTNPSLKSNILISGSTGVGKSEIFRSIHENFDIPVAFEDSNEYTASGYKGKDITDMLLHLYESADGDIEKAQRGILIVDEIDKKAGSEHEVFTSAVINSLLKMMEGHVYSLNTNPHGTGGENFEFDTSLLTFAFTGAFSGIEKYTNKRSMGFVSKEEMINQQIVTNIYTEESLRKYGLLPEFLGRCDTIVAMNDLTEEDLIKIMNTSNKSQLILYRNYLANRGIKFIYDDATIEAIAKKAVKLKRGARSIKKIVESALAFASYEFQSSKRFNELIISPETIEDNKKYILR